MRAVFHLLVFDFASQLFVVEDHIKKKKNH